MLHQTPKMLSKPRALIAWLLAFVLVAGLIPAIEHPHAYANDSEATAQTEEVDTSTSATSKDQAKGSAEPVAANEVLPFETDPLVLGGKSTSMLLGQNRAASVTEIPPGTLGYTFAAGETLTEAKSPYYVTKSQTLRAPANTPGLTIEGKVVLVIAKGVTLTVNGANSTGTPNPGYPGILLTEPNHLRVKGAGTLNATGGSGSNGQNGPNNISDSHGNSGGKGGGAAGAGIGTLSGAGGAAGGGGGKGDDGGAGASGVGVFDSSGQLIISEAAKVTAKSLGGSNPGAGSEVHFGKAALPHTQVLGGGGGGAGGQAAAIGTGAGGGGGGGGSGGSAGWGIEAVGGGGGGGGGYGSGVSGFRTYIENWHDVEHLWEGVTSGGGGPTSGGNGGEGAGATVFTHGGDGSRGGDRGSQMGTAVDVYSTTSISRSPSSTDSSQGNGKTARILTAYPMDECEFEFDKTDPLYNDALIYKYTSVEVKPKMKVIHRPTGHVLDPRAYNLVYSNNVMAGMAMITLQTTGSLVAGRDNLVDPDYEQSASLGMKVFDIRYDMRDFEVAFKNTLPGTSNWYAANPSNLPVGEAYLKHKTGGPDIPANEYTIVCENNINTGVNTAKATITAFNTSKWSNFDPISGLFSIMKPPVITTPNDTSFIDARLGVPYDRQFEATMEPVGADTITFAVAPGYTLPKGLYLSKSGRLTGTPEVGGVQTVKLRATNKAGFVDKEFIFEIPEISGMMYYLKEGVKYPVEGGVVKAYLTGDSTNPLASFTTGADGQYVLTNVARYGKVDLVFDHEDTAGYRIPLPSRISLDLTAGGATVVDKEVYRSVWLTLDPGANGTLAPGQETVKGWPGDKVVVPDAQNKPGWRFAGWFSDPSGGDPIVSTFPKDDATFYAHYDQREYFVNYLTGEGESVSPKAADFDEANLLPNPEPKLWGYRIAKWYLSGDPTRVVTASTKYSELAADADQKNVDIVADWVKRDDIKVTLDSNGSSSYPATIDGVPSVIKEPLTFKDHLDYSPPLRDGFSFVGWSTDKVYAAPSLNTPVMSLTVPGDHTTYYAQWQPKDIAVTFDPMAGTFAEAGEDGVRTGKAGVGFDLTKLTPTRPGYTFTGWFATPTGTDRRFAPDATTFTLPTESIYYYAQWKPAHVEVTLKAPGATPDLQTRSGNFATTVAYDLPSINGASFVGWKEEGNPDSVPKVFLSFPDKDTVYVAEFEAGKITLAYNPAGGDFEQADENGIRTGAYKETYFAPDAPKRAGYTFDGWYTTTEYATLAPATGVFPIASATYYAKWIAADTSAVLNALGSDIETQTPTGKVGDAIIYTVPKIADKTFTGWKKQGLPDDSATMFPRFGAQVAEVYEAVFAAGKVSVSYDTQGGAFATSSSTFIGTPGDTYTIPENPTRPGYDFIEWTTQPNGAGSKVTTNVFPTEKNTTYYAKWQPKHIKVTLQAPDSDEASTKTQTAEGTFSSEITYTTPKRADHVFLGWKTQGALDSAAQMKPKFPESDATLFAVWVKSSLVITYEPQGGTFVSGGSEMKGVPDMHYTTPSVKKVGHTFKGWFTSPVGGALVHLGGVDATMPQEGTTYFAQWIALQTTAELKAPGSSQPSQTLTGDFGTPIGYALPTLAGNAFVGWKVSGSADDTAAMFPTFPDVATTYEAVWAAGQVNVSYDAQGGTFPTGENGIRTGRTGATYPSVVAPSKPGYEFKGWFGNPDGSGAEYTSTTFPADSSTLVYAKWASLRVSVTLDKNYPGAPGAEVVSDGTAGSAIVYTTPVRAGFAFTGWSTTPNNTPGDKVMFPVFADTDKTLYAIWEANKVTATFDPTGGTHATGFGGFITQDANTTYDPTKVLSPSKTGFVFDGWYTASFAGEAVALGTLPSKSVTYFAHWKALETKVTLFDSTDPTATEIATHTGTYNTYVPVADPVRAGYTFKGWVSDPTSNAPVRFLRFAAGDTTYYALWETTKVKDTFDGVGGKVLGDVSVENAPGHTYTVPSAERVGYTFLGWFASPTDNTSDTPSGTLGTQSKTFYAQWEKKSVNLTFDAQGGTIEGNATLDIPGLFGEIVRVADPVRSGYVFGGWRASTATAADKPSFQVSFPAQDTTYNAQWLDAAQANVVYDAQGGSVAGGINVFTGKPGDTYNAPAVDTRTGYTFNGWSTSPTGASEQEAGNEYRFTNNEKTTYYALWSADTYTVRLDYGDGASIVDVSGTFNERIDYTAPVRTGSVFVGWVQDATIDVPALYPRFSEANKGKTLHALWRTQEIGVHFNAMGGQSDSSVAGALGSAYTMPADPVRAGYKFMGWYSLPGGQGDLFDHAAGVSVDFSLTDPASVYAHWEAQSVTVTLDPGFGMPTTQIVGLPGQLITYTAPVYADYTFVGWKAAGNFSLVFPVQDTTLIAQWTTRDVVVTFDSGEGAFADNSTQKIYTGASGLSFPANREPTDADLSPTTWPAPETPHRDNFTFEGWYSDKAWIHEVAPFGLYPGQDIMLFAKWAPVVSTVTLKSPGAKPQNQVETGNAGEAILYEFPVRDGYTFKGWKVEYADDSTATLHPLYPKTDTTYTAVFVAGRTTMRFDTMGGSFVAPETGERTGNAGEGYTLPATTSVKREGYVCMGWSASPVGGSLLDVAQIFPGTGATYYAQWKEENITVELNPNGGTSIKDDYEGDFGTPIAYDIPARVGYAFTGWSTTTDNASNDADMFPKYTQATKGKTLYATWVAGKVNVVFFDHQGATSQLVDVNNTYKVVANPLQTGYRFDGWYSDPIADTTKLNEVENALVNVGSSAGTIAWYAHWKPLDNIELILDPGWGDAPATTSPGKFGEPVSYTTPLHAGYTFAGWKERRVPVASDSEARIGLSYPATNTTYDAVWVANNVEVTFDFADGVTPAEVLAGTTGHTLSTPSLSVRIGYDFAGWWTLAEGGTEVTPTTFPALSATYFAHWTPRSLDAVMISVDDGGTEIGRQELNGTQDALIDYTIPRYAGYGFVGWQRTSSVAPNPNPTELFPKYNEYVAGTPTEYVVQWQADTYSALFIPKDSEFVDPAESGLRSGTAGDTIASVPSLKPRAGYRFAGWWFTPSGGVADQELTDFKIPAEDTLYFPKWEALDISVTLDANQGAFEPHAPVLLKGAPGEVIDYTQSMPKRAGFAFVGWATTPNNPTDTSFVPTFGTATQTLYAQWEAGWASVYFRTQGGKEISGDEGKLFVSGDPEAQYDIPQVTKQGHTFAGWYTDALDRGSVSPGAAGSKGHLPGADITTYYAHWDPDPLEVELVVGAGGVMADPDPIKQGHQDEIIKYVAPTKPGYTFKGWSTTAPTTRSYGALNAEKYPTFDSTLGSQYKLYATWEVNRITVSFDAMGGTHQGGSAGSVTNELAQTYTLPPNPERTGYTFEGWHAQVATHSPHPGPNSAGTYDFPTTNVAYYAHWTADTTEVTLNAPGSDKVQQILSGTFGTTVPYVVPAQENMVFDGWQKQVAAGENPAAVSRSVSFAETDAIYDAVWSVASNVEVVYYTQGGTLVDAPIVEGKPTNRYSGLPKSTYTAPGATRSGYTFKGWFVEPTPADTSVPDHLAGATKVHTSAPLRAYYAVWEVNTLSVVLDENFTGGSVSAVLSGTVDTPVVYTMPKRSGYTFVGWATTADDTAGNKTMFPEFSEALDGTTLFAQWAPGKSSATFFANGGTGGTTIIGDVANPYYVPDNPVRAGYAFDGWYKDKALTNKLEKQPGDELTFSAQANTEYWAKWIITDTTLTLKLLDDTSEVYARFDQASLDPVAYTTPVRAGYTFMGWAATPGLSAGDLSLVQPSVDTTLYGAWSPHSINVSFEANGGTFEGAASFTGKVGDSYVVPAMQPRAGYEFIGWSLLPSDGDIIVPSTKMNPTSEIFFAQWKAKDISVTMKLDGGQVRGVGTDLTYTGKFTDRIAFDTPTKYKHTFLGWRVEGSSNTPVRYLTYPEVDTTYVALWQRDDLLRASYFAEGGSVNGQSSFTDALSDTYTAPGAIAPEGKVFAGWKTNPDTDEISHVFGDVRGFGPEVQLNYYAAWAPRTNINVSFDAKGGTMAGSSEIYVMENLRVGDEIACPTPIKQGATFVGWVDEKTPGSKPAQGLKVPQQDTTYTAYYSEGGESSVRSVVYNPQGGTLSGLSTVVGRFGESYIVPGVLKRPGYVFEGWAQAPEGRVEQKAGALAVFGAKMQTDYYAIWSLDANIAVTLDPNGGAMGSSTDPVTTSGLTFGKAVGYVAPVRTGYIFMGWSLDRNAQSGEVSLSAPAQNTTYYATWLDEHATPEMHSVFYDGMGGEVSESVFSGIKGGTYTAPGCAPRPGWVFTGWAASPIGEPTHAPRALRTFSDNVVEKYFAQWRPAADATVTLDAQGGTLTGQKVYNAQQPGTSFAPSEPVREGYVFVGWSTDPAASAGSGLIVVPPGSSVFYALWTQQTDAQTNLVIYDGAGGYATPGASFSGVEGTSYQAPSATGFAGHSFAGWSTSPTGTLHHSANTPQVIPAIHKTTYYALWNESSRVDLRLVLDGGEIGGSSSDVIVSGQKPGDIVIPDAPVRTGFVFTGWAQEGASAGSSAIVVPDTNTTYTALWTKLAEKKDTRIVQYFGMGGTVVPQSVIIGELGGSYTAPDTAPRAGYSFAGWSDTQDATNVDHQAGQSVSFAEAQQKAYWAKWKRNEASITLDGQGGYPSTQHLTGDQGSPVIYATPTREGYVFAGWSQTPGSSTATSSPMFSPEITGATLYAVWIERIAVVSEPKEGGIIPLDTGGGYTGGSSFGGSDMITNLGGTSDLSNGPTKADLGKTTTKPSFMLGMELTGGDVSFTRRDDKRIYSFKAKDGYELETVVVDGREVKLVDDSYTFDAYGDHTLAANFKQIEPTSPVDIFTSIVRGSSNILLLSLIPLIVGFVVTFAVRRTRRKYKEDKERKEEQGQV